MIGLFIQLWKCVTWSPLVLLPNFDTPSQFSTPLEGIKVLGVPLGTSSFKSSFIKDTLLEDIQHVDILFRLGDVQIAFGILTHCYAEQPSYLLHCTPPSPTFINSLVSFDSSHFRMFGCLLAPRSFDSPKALLAHKQVSLPITLGGIGFIPTSTIAPTTYSLNHGY